MTLDQRLALLHNDKNMSLPNTEMEGVRENRKVEKK